MGVIIEPWLDVKKATTDALLRPLEGARLAAHDFVPLHVGRKGGSATPGCLCGMGVALYKLRPIHILLRFHPREVDGSDSRLDVVGDVERHVAAFLVLEPSAPVEQHSLVKRGDLLDLDERDVRGNIGQDLVVPITTALEYVVHLEHG